MSKAAAGYAEAGDDDEGHEAETEQYHENYEPHVHLTYEAARTRFEDTFGDTDAMSCKFQIYFSCV